MADRPSEELDRKAGLVALLRSVSRWGSVRVVLVLGALLRLVFVLSPSIPHEGGDATSYLVPAHNLLHAGQFAMGTCPGAECSPLLWRVPVYSIFLALFKELPHLPVGAIYVEQILLDSVSVLLAAVIGWWLRDKRLGVIAAAFVALNPFIAVFAAEVMSEPLTDVLVLLLTYWLLVAADRKLELRARSLLGLGVLMGVLALTRQVFAVIPAFALLCLLSRPLKRWFRAAVFVSVGFWTIVTPWIVRQVVVVQELGITDMNKVMLADRYANIVRPGFAAWERSFEEPFFLENFDGPPTLAKYFLPNEKERTTEVFARLNANHLVNSPDIDAEFAALARERREAHPLRTRVWAPMTRIFKSFAAPRLSGLGIVTTHLMSGPGKLLVALAIAFNFGTSLPGFVYGLMRLRDERYRVILMFPIFNVLAYLPVTFGGQSRYMVPVLAHLALLTGTWALVALERMKKRTAASEEPEAAV